MDICPDCNQPLGSNDHCRNCVDYQNHAADDNLSDSDTLAWHNLLDRLRNDDPDN